MKNLFILSALVLSCVCSNALTVIKVSQFPNIPNPGTNFLLLLANAGDTNYNMTLDQASTWLANYPGFVSSLSANTNLTFGTISTNWPTQTYSGNVVWTNTTCYTNAAGNFTSAAVYNPSPVTHARLVISNSLPTVITNNLPFIAYSLSLGTNVTQAYIAGGSVLELQFDYYNGTYYVKDYGKNNSTLSQLANITNSGTLFITNGTIFVH